MDELLDILDENYQVIGQDTRTNIHEQELLHAAFHCWFYKIYGDIPYVLFQMRNGRVAYPNLLDITAAGHLAAGEKPADGAREIEEELGIKIPFEDLESIGQFRDAIPGKNNKIDNELCHLYTYHLREPIETLKLEKNEVDSILCVAIQDFNGIINSKQNHTIEGYLYDGESLSKQKWNLSMKDFVPHKWEFYQYIVNNLLKLKIT